jgi:CubicO group peptidase (beta-lactamase class C family)
MTDLSAEGTAGPVTLANWRQAPFNRQSFHDVGALVPVERIDPAGRASALPPDPHPIDHIQFEDQDGRERTLGEVLESTWTRGLVVLRGGRLVAERYGEGYDGTRPHILFSVSKSVTAALAGVLVDRGELDPDSAVTRYLPEVAASAYGDCSVRHVLDMTVNSSFVEDYNDWSGDYGRYRRATLWNPSEPGVDPGTLHGFLAGMPRAPGPHGEVFRYLSPNTDLLGWVLERAAGRSFAALLSELVWQPIGTEAAAVVTVDREGTARTAGGLCVLPRDLARFGEMMRCDGVAQGHRVLPAWWVSDILEGGDSAPWHRGAMSYLFPAGRYRTQWYQVGNASGAFCAIGIHGQWLWIDLAREVVIAKVSAQPDPTSDAIDLALIRAFDALAAAL